MDTEQQELTDEERERIDALMKLPLWYGYLHVNGSIHAKRFFDNRDLIEAHESPFVVAVVTAFPCENHDDALKQINEKLLQEREVVKK